MDYGLIDAVDYVVDYVARWCSYGHVYGWYVALRLVACAGRVYTHAGLPVTVVTPRYVALVGLATFTFARLVRTLRLLLVVRLLHYALVCLPQLVSWVTVGLQLRPRLDWLLLPVLRVTFV